MNIICISGKAQHGKDTTANILCGYLKHLQKRAIVVHYADLLKYMCKTFFGWNGEKDEQGRKLLQYVGTDVVRALKPDFWCDFIIKVLKLFPDEWDYVIIADCRFPNEINALRVAGYKPLHLRVARPNFISPLTPEQQKHPSETALDEYPIDYFIHNDGTEYELEDKIKAFAWEVFGI